MSTNRVNGRDLRIFLSADGSNDLSSAKSILYATSCELSLTGQIEKTIDKDSPKTGISELSSTEWTMTTNNLVSSDLVDFDTLIDKLQEGTEVTVAFCLVDNASDEGLDIVGAWKAGKGRWGKAVITSFSSSAPAEGKATYTATFTGNGKLKKSSSSLSGGTGGSGSTSGGDIGGSSSSQGGL